MTFCKTLKTEQIGEYIIEATEEIEKYSSVPEYRVIVSKDGIAFISERTAKTTWRKKYAAIKSEYER